jgi:hypothetical protein
MITAASSHLTGVLLAAAPPPPSGGGGHKTNSPWPLFLIGAVFLIIGLVNLLNPGLQYRMRSWQFKNKEAQEPSDLALKVGRAFGALFAIIGVVLVVIGFTKL